VTGFTVADPALERAWKPLVIAHRGASATHRENTVEAYRAARDQGAVHHDAVIPGVGPLAELRADELPPWVPLLDAAYEACEGMAVNVEIKNAPTEPDFDPDDRVAAAVVDLVVANRLQDRTLVSCFNLATVDRVRELDPSVPTAWLTLTGYDQLWALQTVVDRGHVAIHPQDPAVTPDLMAAARDAGVTVNTWTVDDPERIRALAAMAVDGICTNDPALAVRVLKEERG
jgi:glycerophosphoryl diester phosphodiesterase